MSNELEQVFCEACEGRGFLKLKNGDRPICQVCRGTGKGYRNKTTGEWVRNLTPYTGFYYYPRFSSGSGVYYPFTNSAK